MKRPTKPTFSARGDLCPICKKNFRDPDVCPHSVGQALDRIEADHLGAMIRFEIAKEEKKRAKAKRKAVDEFTQRLFKEIGRGPTFPGYPAVRDLDFALEVALEQIEEWDHDEDPHGWCHQRPILITLLAAHLDRVSA